MTELLNVLDVLSLAIALVTLVGSVVLILKVSAVRRGYLRRGYWIWLAVTVTVTAIAVLNYSWGPTSPSIWDGLLLRSRYAGWSYILIGYAALAGALVGGAIVAVRTLTAKT